MEEQRIALPASTKSEIRNIWYMEFGIAIPPPTVPPKPLAQLLVLDCLHWNVLGSRGRIKSVTGDAVSASEIDVTASKSILAAIHGRLTAPGGKQSMVEM